jgi:breast cancer 2 susceptibility protein
MTPTECGWLARFVRDKIQKDRERAGEEIEQELTVILSVVMVLPRRLTSGLQNICPEREVRNFRILIVKDVRTHRRPAHRKAQMTVWDVLGLSLGEGDTENFQAGQRFRVSMKAKYVNCSGMNLFQVTNLIPTQQNAWMNRDEGSEVYLATRRDSRWTRIR